MGKTLGVGFLNVKAFCDEQQSGGWRELLARMPPEDTKALGNVVVIGWYDLALYARLIRAVDARFGRGDLRLLETLGRFEAERDLTSFFRLMLRVANPAYVVEKTGAFWSRYHDSGHWEVTRESKTALTGVLRDWAVVDEALCVELVGYLSRTLELVGAREVVLRHTECRSRGAQACVFRGEWAE